MSICRGRLYFGTKAERRSQDSDVIQSLNFHDSDDGEFDSSVNDASMESVSPQSSSAERSPGFWDSILESPSNQVSSPPKTFRKSPRLSMTSPIPFSFEDSEDEHPSCDNGARIPPLPRSPFTPPHKKMSSLRLYDTPHTPKSLLQKAQRRITRVHKNNRLNATSGLRTPSGNKPCSETTVTPKLLLNPSRPQANVNPFTPINQNNNSVTGLTGLKRPRNGSLLETSLEEDIHDDMPTNKKLALHEINTSRYNEEFHQVCKLGDGEFGSVYKCINRLDGCTYAIKKSKRPVAGSVYERTAMNEVYAHAVLGQHPRVVRYYSAWAENDHMYIQNEYCNGGSLAELLLEYQVQGRQLSEMELKQLLLQLAQGLKYIHSQNLVHMDIKPGNVFIHLNSGLSPVVEEEEEDEETQAAKEIILYKIGDLGHVTSITSPLVEEGDCRYLPNEILQENYQHLSKADIFSVALTVLEAGGVGELPKNGEAWHKIRSGVIPVLDLCSEEFNSLLQSMVHPDPQSRPSAASLVQHPVLCPFAQKSRAQLRRELNEERFKNELLTRQLQQATKMTSPSMKTNNNNMNTRPSGGRQSRLIGRKSNRSMSLNTF